MKIVCMAAKRTLEEDLLALAALNDCDIDTSDAPETLSFEGAQIGRYSDLKFRGYDVRSIANWVIKTARDHNLVISNLWLNKFVYFIVERALIANRTLLTPARIEAWEFGPVFRELYFNYPNNSIQYYYKFNVQKRSKEIAQEPFEAEDVELFKSVWREYAHYSASQLTSISHRSGTAWHKIWENGGKTNPGMVIDIQAILGRDDGQGDGSD